MHINLIGDNPSRRIGVTWAFSNVIPGGGACLRVGVIQPGSDTVPEVVFLSPPIHSILGYADGMH